MYTQQLGILRAKKSAHERGEKVELKNVVLLLSSMNKKELKKEKEKEDRRKTDASLPSVPLHSLARSI
jgi:hypothetical protein